MCIDMLAQSVHFRLLHIAQIAYAQRHLFADGRIKGYHVAPLRGTDYGGGHYVMVVVATRENLVIRLSVVGRARMGLLNN